MKWFGFSKSKDGSCVYVKASGSIVTFLVLYVDDILLIGNDIPTLQEVKSWLGKYFFMKDLEEAAYILGIRILRDRKDVLLVSVRVHTWKNIKLLQYGELQERGFSYSMYYKIE